MAHVWVQHRIMPITLREVIGNPKEGEVWFQYSYDLAAEAAAEEEAAYGCDMCGIALTPDTVYSECKGVPNDVSKLLQP